MTDLGLPHVHSGKVRDIYAVDDDRLLMVTSDRISAFDVVMDEPIAHKGRVLTAMSAFWFDRLADVVAGHLVSTDVGDLPPSAQKVADEADLAGRVMLTRKADMLPVECIVRGYITGSAWKEYRTAGTMHGTRLPEGLLESQQLPEAVFTPSTKADVGDHDENISFDAAAALVGDALAAKLRRRVARPVPPRRRLGPRARHHHRRHQVRAGPDRRRARAVRRGADARLVPLLAHRRVASRAPPRRRSTSSRSATTSTGSTGTRRPPPPALPHEVVAATSDRYVEAYERITGRSFADWPGVGD